MIIEILLHQGSGISDFDDSNGLFWLYLNVEDNGTWIVKYRRKIEAAV